MMIIFYDSFLPVCWCNVMSIPKYIHVPKDLREDSFISCISLYRSQKHRILKLVLLISLYFITSHACNMPLSIIECDSPSLPASNSDPVVLGGVQKEVFVFKGSSVIVTCSQGTTKSVFYHTF